MLLVVRKRPPLASKAPYAPAHPTGRRVAPWRRCRPRWRCHANPQRPDTMQGAPLCSGLCRHLSSGCDGDDAEMASASASPTQRVQSHPLDTLSADDMTALPWTPRLGTSRSMHSLPSPPSSTQSARSVPTPGKTRRVRYVKTLQDASPRNVSRSEDVDHILAMCYNVSIGRIQRMAPVHKETLHAIAAKERICMELREELAREEAQLEELRSAWKRMTMRIGTHPPAHVPHRRLPPASPTAQPTRETSRIADHAKAAETWPDWRRIPSQLSNQFHAMMDQFQTADHDTGPSSSPTQDRAVRASKSRRFAASRAHTQDMLSITDELHPDILREKLSSGWHVLSQRLRDTTASFADLSTWAPDDPPPTSSQSSRASLPFSMEDTAFGAVSGLDAMHRAATASSVSPLAEMRHAPAPEAHPRIV